MRLAAFNKYFRSNAITNYNKSLTLIILFFQKVINRVKIHKHKGIKDSFILELGQLNVVCGQNSSGKTSILEALDFEKGKSLEVSWNTQEIQEMSTHFQNSGNITLGPKHSSDLSLAKWFTQNWLDILGSNGAIFQDSISQVERNFRQELGKSPYKSILRDPFFDMDFNLKKFVEPKRKESINTLLIPAKRFLSSKCKIDFNEELAPYGGGVINRLFYLKNQSPNSENGIVYKRILSEFKWISGHSFDVVPNPENEISILFLGSKANWLSSDDCGLGLSDLLITLTHIISQDLDLYMIEEPENHLYPDLQRRLLGFLKGQDKQFIISTHSDVFIDHNQVDKVFYCWYDGKVQLSDQTSLSKIVSELGFSTSEKLTSDALILVEGPTDIPVLQKLFELLDTSNDFNLKFWPLGGDIMASLDLSVFEERQNTFAIIDQDPKSGKHRRAFKKNCDSHNIDCLQLEKYAIENYFTLKAIKAAFPGQIPKSIAELKATEKIDKQIGFEQKAKSIKQRTPTILKHMTLENFEGTDLLTFIRKIDSKLRANTEQSNN